jgi:hypothetical protein
MSFLEETTLALQECNRAIPVILDRLDLNLSSTHLVGYATEDISDGRGLRSGGMALALWWAMVNRRTVVADSATKESLDTQREASSR